MSECVRASECVVECECVCVSVCERESVCLSVCECVRVGERVRVRARACVCGHATLKYFSTSGDRSYSECVRWHLGESHTIGVCENYNVFTFEQVHKGRASVHSS